MTIENTQLFSWYRNKALFALSVAIILSFALATLAQGQPSSGPAKAAEALTHQLVGLNKRLQHASPTARARALDELQAVATRRQALLAELIKNDPGAVLRVALPQRIRAGMPAEVQDRLEQRIELEGDLEVYYEDYEDDHRLRHFLNVGGKRISLHFRANPPGLLSGTSTSASGLLLNDAMALDSGDHLLTLAADGGADGGGNGGAPAIMPDTFGAQRTLVLLVNFQNEPDIKPWTPSQVQDLVLGTVSDFYLENSFGQTWLTGDVYGWYTLPIPTTECNQYSIANEAKSAATNMGVDVSTYGRILYVFPRNSCTWSGLSTVGGNPSESWINNDFTLRIVGHELGHGFGLFHSQGLNCTPGTLGSDCSTLAYGDTLDIMGGRAAHLNAFQKERLGWLNFDVSPPITTVDTSGSHQITPAESAGTEAKALKVLKSIDPVTGNKTWYYLEHRRAIGFDSWMLGDPYIDEENVQNGIVLHLGTEADGDSSLLLDMTPDSPSIYGDLFDPALVVGQSYSDAEAGLTITTEWADGSTAAVNVNLGQTDCVHANPTVSLLPSASQWANPGTSVSYNVTVTNNDNNACGTTGFDLSAIAPTGWDVELNNSALQIAPGGSASTTMIVTSPLTASEGFYDITITADNSNDSIHSGTAVATYVIESPGSTPNCTTQQPQLTISPDTQSADPGTTLTFDISLVNTDSQECGSSNFYLTRILPGWSGSISPSSITLAPGASSYATLSATSLDSTGPGSYTLQVMVYDNQEPLHDASVTATYLVNETSTSDTTPPTVPSGLTANQTTKQVALAWNHSSDNVGVAGYHVYRDGVTIATTADTSYSDRNLEANIMYEYTVSAYDAANNASAQSNPVVSGKGKAKGKGTGGGKGKGNN